VNKIIVVLLLLIAPIVNAIEKIPADDETYIYGLGIDAEHSNAQKFALADITQKLSTRVQSSVGISQSKSGNVTNTDTKQKTTAVSQEIELPNVHVLESVKKDNQWRVLIRVERKLVQLALKQQLEDLNDELSFLLEDFAESQGPSCWFTLTTNIHKKEKLSALIPAYIGSGMKEESTLSFKKQTTSFDRLLKRCKYKNKYTINYPKQAPINFKNLFEQLMKNQGYKVTNQKKNAGTIDIKFKEKQTYVYKNHLNIISAEVSVLDEFGDTKKHVKLKSKGSSFNNKKEASRKAVINLIKKIETLIIKL
jgi:hypothetical protein